jgi:GDPmannose 4,6-dehydratase
MKTALITGITGQDGAYLARHLLNEGYRVVGTRRRSASTNTWRLDELGITDRVEIATIEMLEFGSILSALQESKPDEIYNLAAQSFVGASFGQPIFTWRPTPSRSTGCWKPSGSSTLRPGFTRPPPRRCSAASAPKA